MAQPAPIRVLLPDLRPFADYSPLFDKNAGAKHDGGMNYRGRVRASLLRASVERGVAPGALARRAQKRVWDDR